MAVELWVKTDRGVEGPFVVKVIRQKIREGEIAGDALLSKDRRKWQSVDRVFKNDTTLRTGQSKPDAAATSKSAKAPLLPSAYDESVDAAPVATGLDEFFASSDDVSDGRVSAGSEAKSRRKLPPVSGQSKRRQKRYVDPEKWIPVERALAKFEYCALFALITLRLSLATTVVCFPIIGAVLGGMMGGVDDAGVAVGAGAGAIAGIIAAFVAPFGYLHYVFSVRGDLPLWAWGLAIYTLALVTAPILPGSAEFGGAALIAAICFVVVGGFAAIVTALVAWCQLAFAPSAAKLQSYVYIGLLLTLLSAVPLVSVGAFFCFVLLLRQVATVLQYESMIESINEYLRDVMILLGVAVAVPTVLTIGFLIAGVMQSESLTALLLALLALCNLGYTAAAIKAAAMLFDILTTLRRHVPSPGAVAAEES